MKVRCHSEHAEQVALFCWAGMARARHPELALLFAIPNGGHRHIQVARRLYEQAALHGVKLDQIIVRCEIHDVAGHVVADGVGARADAGLRRHQQGAEDGGEVGAHRRHVAHGGTLRGVHPGSGGYDSSQGRGNANGDTQGDRLAGTAPERRTITEGQRQRLEARIQLLGVDRKRVIDWMCRATYGHITRFADLTPNLYARVFDKINQLAVSVATAGRGGNP